MLPRTNEAAALMLMLRRLVTGKSVRAPRQVLLAVGNSHIMKVVSGASRYENRLMPDIKVE